MIQRVDGTRGFRRRLMEMGFIPGSPVTMGRSAPGGDPQVFQVDGSEVALRRKTAARLRVRLQLPKSTE